MSFSKYISQTPQDFGQALQVSGFIVSNGSPKAPYTENLQRGSNDLFTGGSGIPVGTLVSSGQFHGNDPYISWDLSNPTQNKVYNDYDIPNLNFFSGFDIVLRDETGLLIQTLETGYYENYYEIDIENLKTQFSLESGRDERRFRFEVVANDYYNRTHTGVFFLTCERPDVTGLDVSIGKSIKFQPKFSKASGVDSLVLCVGTGSSFDIFSTGAENSAIAYQTINVKGQTLSNFQQNYDADLESSYYYGFYAVDVYGTGSAYIYPSSIKPLEIDPLNYNIKPSGFRGKIVVERDPVNRNINSYYKGVINKDFTLEKVNYEVFVFQSGREDLESSFAIESQSISNVSFLVHGSGQNRIDYNFFTGDNFRGQDYYYSGSNSEPIFSTYNTTGIQWREHTILLDNQSALPGGSYTGQSPVKEIAIAAGNTNSNKIYLGVQIDPDNKEFYFYPEGGYFNSGIYTGTYAENITGGYYTYENYGPSGPSGPSGPTGPTGPVSSGYAVLLAGVTGSLMATNLSGFISTNYEPNFTYDISADTDYYFKVRPIDNNGNKGKFTDLTYVSSGDIISAISGAGYSTGLFNGDTNSGLAFYNADLDVLNISDNLFSSGSGLGVNISTPEHHFHVSGDAQISGYLYDSQNTTGEAGYVLASEEGGPQWKQIEDVLSGVGGSGVTNYVARWADEDTLTTGVLYDNGINVGIGTTSPSEKLEISIGNVFVNGNNGQGIKLGSTNGIFRQASNELGFNTNNSERMRIDASGNVGIGTTVPAHKLEVTDQALIDGLTVGRGGGSVSTNTAVGTSALENNTTGIQNTASGMYSLSSNTTGSYNTAHGYFSLLSNTTGQYNTAHGTYSLLSNTTGQFNTAVGFRSLNSNTTGSYNIAVGMGSLFSNTTGCCNTAVGMYSLYSNTTGIQNTASGMYALFSNTTGAQNTATGFCSLALNVSGSSNTAFGYHALKNNTESNNVAFGRSALQENTTGTNNTAVGYESLYLNTTGVHNTAIGRCAGCNITTGSCNIFIGAKTEGGSVTDSNAIAIGYDVNTCGSNTINIGNSLNTKTIFEYGNVGIGNPADSGGNGALSSLVTLRIGGTGTIDSDAGQGLLQLRGYSANVNQNVGTIEFVDDRNGTDDIIGRINSSRDTSIGDGNLKFSTATSAGVLSEAMRIDSSGNVGIGTTSPSYKLDVSGNARVTTDLFVNDQLAVKTTTLATSNAFHVSSGTTGSASKSSIALVSVADNSTFYNGPAALHVINSGNRGTKGNSSGSDLLRLEFSDSIHTIFDKNGNVGIGTTDPNDKLEIHGNMRVRGTDGFGANTTANYNPSFVAFLGGGKTGSASSSQAGYVKITLPVSWTNTMMQFSVDVFEHSGYKTKTFKFAGYNHDPSSSWINTSAMVFAGNDGETYRVQFGHDGSKCAIYISKGTSGASSSWVYPQIVVRDASFGFLNTNISNWIDGWDVGFTVTLGTITQTRDIQTQITGAGTSQYIPKWDSTGTALNDSVIVQDSNNIGIGTSSPQAKLEVNTGDIFTTNSLAGSVLLMPTGASGGTYGAGLVFGMIRTDADAGAAISSVGKVGDSDPAGLAFFYHGSSQSSGRTEGMRIDSSGNVGIGTISPSQKLHVQGNLRVTGAFYDSNNSTGSSGEILSSTGSGTDWVSLCQISGVTANGSQTTCYIPKWTDGTNEVIGNSVIYENASGNIGINCTTPSYKLHVNGSFAATCKSFVINHPTKCGHMLRYGSLESPYHGVRLTGKSCAVCGEAKVALPDYMCGLVHEEDINIQITNYRHGCTMWVEDVDISNNNFKVKTGTEETKEFYWTFTAERKDVDRMQTEYKNV